MALKEAAFSGAIAPPDSLSIRKGCFNEGLAEGLESYQPMRDLL